MKQRSKKIYILGKDVKGWSIEKDREHIIGVISSLDEYRIVKNILRADIIYVVWWNMLLSKKMMLFMYFIKKEIIATITNDLSHQIEDIKRIKDRISFFVYANSHQKNQLLSLGISSEKMMFNPFYVSEKIFKKLNISRDLLCDKLSLDSSEVEGKILIGSFQRDSLGNNLTKQKWQKNPDLLIDILRNLEREKYTLILAGPRRHYIINQCKKYKINYLFIGDESYIDAGEDDIDINTLSLDRVAYLYNLIDIYIVSSTSEGGPKAIPESILCGTPVLSTDVGFAVDLLCQDSIYLDSCDAVRKINNISLKSSVNDYYTYSSFRERIKTILGSINK